MLDFLRALEELWHTKKDRHWLSLAYAMYAHRGQKYGEGPYWKHLLKVADYGYDMGVSPSVAFLHDLLEDTKYPLPFWLTQREKALVRTLTKDKIEPYFSYINRIRDSGLDAIRAKIADNSANIVRSVSGTDRREKYAKAQTMLFQAYNRELYRARSIE